MSTVLKHEDLQKALMLVKNNPANEQMKADFIDLVKPIIKHTCDKYPSNLSEDMAQEMRIFIMKRSDYIANKFFLNEIDNPTNYLFTVCRNAAMNFFKKESKHTTHIIPIDDIKIDPIYKPKTGSKQKILDEVRQQMLGFIQMRFMSKIEQKQAERFLTVLMEGKRPSFENKILEKFSKAKQQNAKDIYSIILMKLRELLEPKISDLLE